MAYYVIKRKFHMSDEDFWASSYKKISYLISMLADEYDTDSPTRVQPQVKTISSMKEITGWC